MKNPACSIPRVHGPSPRCSSDSGHTFEFVTLSGMTVTRCRHCYVPLPGSPVGGTYPRPIELTLRNADR